MLIASTAAKMVTNAPAKVVKLLRILLHCQRYQKQRLCRVSSALDLLAATGSGHLDWRDIRVLVEFVKQLADESSAIAIRSDSHHTVEHFGKANQDRRSCHALDSVSAIERRGTGDEGTDSHRIV